MKGIYKTMYMNYYFRKRQIRKFLHASSITTAKQLFSYGQSILFFSNTSLQV